MYLEIVTPDKSVFSGEVKFVKLPGSQGAFGVLKNHAPLISTLEEGILKVVALDGAETFFQVDGGVVEVLEDNIIVLVEKA